MRRDRAHGAVLRQSGHPCAQRSFRGRPAALDLARLRIICFLRTLEIPIDSIRQLFEEENAEQVIELLLTTQEQTLRGEIAEKLARADRIAEARKALRHTSQVSAGSIPDVARLLENKKRLDRLRRLMLVCALPMNLIELGTAAWWIKTGQWLPFALGMAAVAVMGTVISLLYFRTVAYICPDCHTVFRPRLRDSFWARHTLYTRRLCCPHCGYRGFCVETCTEKSRNSFRNSKTAVLMYSFAQGASGRRFYSVSGAIP